MTTTPEIDAAKEALAAAETEVARLQANLRAALDDQAARGISAEGRDETPRNGTSAAAGREEALRRYGRTNSGQAEAETDRQRTARHRREDAAEVDAAKAARGRADEGKAEAQRRITDRAGRAA
ncbi:hypothetical protein [Blastococcus sp. SYSU D01042]